MTIAIILNTEGISSAILNIIIQSGRPNFREGKMSKNIVLLVKFAKESHYNHGAEYL